MSESRSEVTKAKTQPLFDDPVIPATVRDETATVPRGECGYWLLLTDEEVELMSTGLCPADVARKCWEMLGWKREHYRNEAREQATA